MMEGKLKQAVLECLRMGEDPNEVYKVLERLAGLITEAVHYKPQNAVADFYQAIQDAKYRP